MPFEPRVVAGTDVSEPIDIADDPNGAERVLRAAMAEPRVARVVVITATKCGMVETFTNVASVEEAMGFLQRAVRQMAEIAENIAEDSFATEGDPDT